MGGLSILTCIFTSRCTRCLPSVAGSAFVIAHESSFAALAFSWLLQPIFFSAAQIREGEEHGTGEGAGQQTVKGDGQQTGREQREMLVKVMF